MTFSLLCKNKVVEKPLDHMKNHELDKNRKISTPNNALNSVSQRMTQLEDIRNTYGNPYDPISVDDEEDTQGDDTFFA